jgi:hypothetical protein
MTKPLPRQAIELRLDGLDFRDIGERLDVDHFTAIELVQEALDQLPDDLPKNNRDTAVALECLRLNAMQVAIWGKALAGDLDAVLCALDIIAQRTQLLGLATPDVSPQEVTH